MSKQLYEEALAEVRQLKQIAEDNAKKAIMEEVTPRIKQLIESQILEKSLDEFEECDAPRLEPRDGEQVIGDTANEADSCYEEENVLEISPTVESVLRELSHTQPSRLREFKMLTYRLGKKIINESTKNYGDLLETLKAVYVLLQEKVEDSGDRRKIEETLDKYYRAVLKQQEFNEMNRSRRRGLREAKLDISIDGFNEDVLDDDVLSNLKVEIVPSSEGEEPGEDELDGGEEGDDDLGDLGDEEEGGEESDDDLGDLGDEEEGGDEDLEDIGEEEPEPKQEGRNRRMNTLGLSDNTVVEIDEGMLRREIARMKLMREAAEAAPVEKKSLKGKKMTPKVLSSFGGGKSMGDPWLDGDVTTESLDELAGLLEAEDDFNDPEAIGDGNDNPMNEFDLDELSDNTQGDDELSDNTQGDDELTEFEMDEMDDSNSRFTSGDVVVTGGPTGPITSNEEGYGGAAHMEGEEMLEFDGDPEAEVPETEEAYDVNSNEREDTNKEARQPGATLEARRRLSRVVETRNAAISRGRKARRVMEAARRAGNKAVYVKAKKVYAEAARTFVSATKAARVLKESLAQKQRSNSSAGRESAALRKQLAETNLFNAKLLYTNKLLQNESLSPRQKVTIIEKLDEARSIREAKLVYESLTRTISSGRERISESADRQVLGSASRATRPGSTVSLNEGYEAARWAKLAGITK